MGDDAARHPGMLGDARDGGVGEAFLMDRGDGRRDELAPPQIFDSDLGHPRAVSVRCRTGSGRPCATVRRSEEHTSELQSLMRISYAALCLTKTKHTAT